MNIQVHKNYNDLSLTVARHAADYINKNPGSLICFAAGNTPLGAYRELVAMQYRGEIDLSSVYYVGLDEWIGLGADDKGSCFKVMHDTIYEHIKKERIFMFDGLETDTEKQCRETESQIATHGGIDYTILGIGMNGHIGFNEPGTPDIEGCFTVSLDETTKSVSKKYFGESLPVTKGITIGWRTLYNAKNIVIMATGAEKAPIVSASVSGPCTADVPASLFRNHDNIIFMFDNEASLMLNK